MGRTFAITAVTLASLTADCTRHGADSKPAAKVTVAVEWPGGEAELPEGGSQKTPGAWRSAACSTGS
jgi:hypothetical protein